VFFHPQPKTVNNFKRNKINRLFVGKSNLSATIYSIISQAANGCPFTNTGTKSMLGKDSTIVVLKIGTARGDQFGTVVSFWNGTVGR
jgi:hypothetical protein